MQTQVDVPKELLDRLDMLASKLGVAAQHLWPVLIRQARAEGYVFLGLGMSLVMVLGYCMYCCASRGMELSKPDPKYPSSTIGDSEPWFVASCFLGLGVLVSSTGLFAGALRLFNPEYYAFTGLLSLLTGKN